ncbi:hypothetical protein MMC13_005715 [Lambiella insularis]|nr:hypothetical protein [Lambiella insularis]
MELRHMSGLLQSNTTNATILINSTTTPFVQAPTSYSTFRPHSGLMVAHIVLMIIAWVFILPVGVMLSIARSRLASPTQLVFLLFNAFGLLFGIVYNGKTPDLYENNAHHKIGWVATWVVLIQAMWGIVRRYRHPMPANEKHDGNAIAQHQRVPDLSSATQYRYSRDSGQGTEPNSPRTSLPSFLPSLQASDDSEASSHAHGQSDRLEEEALEKETLLKENVYGRSMSTKLSWLNEIRGAKCLHLLYETTDRIVLFLGFVVLLTGGVTYGGFFKGWYVFSGLAHFVKGGIFFWYGLLTLARVLGSFADLGWSWNIKPPASVVGSRKAVMPTAEFVESFLIFFYGITNVFLERLGSSSDDAWSAGDLEHASISVMFFGGGLCGMLVESGRIRDLLNSTLMLSINSRSFGGTSIDQWQAPKTYGFSMNPLPAIIILLLGMLMSGHHQSLMVSTMLHKMWGNLFLAAALARGVTYVLMYLSPPTSLLPSRPPSEIVVAFCLISGGMLFMSSNQDMVESLDARQLNAMFVFTVMMGVTATLMAWEIIVLAIKAWASLRGLKIFVLQRRYPFMYRLNTYPLIHVNFLHALLNVFALTPLMERFEADNGTLLTAAMFVGPLSTLPAGLYLLVERGVLRGNTAVQGASVWVFVLLGIEAMKAYRSNPYFSISTFQIPTWTTPLFVLVCVTALVSNTSFLGHLCSLGVGYIYGLGYLKILAPPEKILRWIEGKLNLLGRVPHYVSVDQKTFGRYGVLPSSAPSSAGIGEGSVPMTFIGSTQRLGP